MSKRRGRKESAVLAGVIAYLKIRRDIYWWRNQTGGARFGEFMLKFGKKGAADIIGLQAPTGRMFAIETKREIGGELSKDQEVWRDNFIAHGGLYILATETEHVRQGLGEQHAHVVWKSRERVIPR